MHPSMLSSKGSEFVGAWLSLVERLVRDQEVGGSNPLAPTIYPLKSLSESTAEGMVLPAVSLSLCPILERCPKRQAGVAEDRIEDPAPHNCSRTPIRNLNRPTAPGAGRRSGMTGMSDPGSKATWLLYSMPDTQRESSEDDPRR